MRDKDHKCYSGRSKDCKKNASTMVTAASPFPPCEISCASGHSTKSHRSGRSSVRKLLQRSASFCKSLLVPEFISCRDNKDESSCHDLTEFTWIDNENENNDDLYVPEALADVKLCIEGTIEDIERRILKYEKTFRDALELAKARYLNGSRNSAVVAMRKHYNYCLRAELFSKAQTRLEKLLLSVEDYIALAKFQGRNGLLPAQGVHQKADEYNRRLQKCVKPLANKPETSRTHQELLDILRDILPQEPR